MADWSQLPADLLTLIARRLHFADDYVRFGIVCKSWHTVFLQKDHLCSLLPWMMLPENVGIDLRGFYNPFSQKLNGLYLPEIRGRRCWGSSCGWLVTLDAEYRLYLVNPVSRVQILLPPLHKCSNIKNLICDRKLFRDSFVHKVLLSSNPLSGNCVVLAIYSDNMMAFSKPGDEAWTPLQCFRSLVHDAMCFGGNFYATSSGRVIIYDSNGIHLKTVALTVSFEHFEKDEIATYIIELCGQIHVVLRIMYPARYGDHSLWRTWTFKVYRLDISTERWEDVEDLGNWSIFLGSNHSFTISSSDYPECRSNCIYFTDDCFEQHYDPTIFCSYDMGIYRLDNREIQPLLEKEFSRFIYSQPVWIKPVLW